MKERPILFNAPMVRALLAGRKTQTRRILKFSDRDLETFLRLKNQAACCPYGMPGHRLWVRETFVQGYPYDATTDRLLQWDADGNELPKKTWYRADGDGIGWSGDDGWEVNTPWKPSIHMPRTASRITLEVTGVRVERLQGISEADAAAEGVHTDPACPAYDAYQALWEQINGPGSWAANPWVWAIKFKRIDKEGAP